MCFPAVSFFSLSHLSARFLVLVEASGESRCGIICDDMEYVENIIDCALLVRA